MEVEALRFLGVQGFTLFLEEVVRLESGDAAPFLFTGLEDERG